MPDLPFGKPSLRRAYDALERRVEPPLTAIVTNAETYNALAAVAHVRRLIGSRVDGVTSAVWHRANLPTRGDVRRLRTQIGQLDREVRRLTVQLELERDRRSPRGGDDERD